MDAREKVPTFSSAPRGHLVPLRLFDGWPASDHGDEGAETFDGFDADRGEGLEITNCVAQAWFAPGARREMVEAILLAAEDHASRATCRAGRRWIVFVGVGQARHTRRRKDHRDHADTGGSRGFKKSAAAVKELVDVITVKPERVHEYQPRRSGASACRAAG